MTFELFIGFQALPVRMHAKQIKHHRPQLRLEAQRNAPPFSLVQSGLNEEAMSELEDDTGNAWRSTTSGFRYGDRQRALVVLRGAKARRSTLEFVKPKARLLALDRCCTTGSVPAEISPQRTYSTFCRQLDAVTFRQECGIPKAAQHSTQCP